jgi:cytochrome oxidase assembly protein ShyY1
VVDAGKGITRRRRGVDNRVPLADVYRFLFRPKWLLFLAGCIAVAVLFVNLGFWQLDRLDQRHAQNDRVRASRHAEPAAPADVLSTDRVPAKRDQYRRVSAVGRYDPDHEYLVRGRTVNDQAGLYVLTPLTTSDGTVLPVVRGWVAASSEGAAVAPDFPAAPSGEVTVVGRVRPPDKGALQETKVGRYPTVKRINVQRLDGKLGGPTYLGYLELVSQTPAADGKLVTIPEPPIEEGPHLAYAVQWFLFAGMLFVGYGIYARREEQGRLQPPAEAESEVPVSPSTAG